MESITGAILLVLGYLYSVTGSLGFAILIFTAIIRTILLPLTLPALKVSEQMKKIQPELKGLKKKFKDDKAGLQKAQLDLYKKYNVNPLGGCLPQLLQLGVVIVLYRALIAFLHDPLVEGISVSTSFLWLDLSKPDPRYILPILAAGSQLILSLMIAPGAETKDIVPNTSKSKKIQKENEKEEDVAEMASSMQQQMLYIMPVMTGIIAVQFPSGLALYWVATTVFSIAQQYYLSGPGGLLTYYQRAVQFIQKNKE
ncbi:MAG: YidC/Oxa1 family membrane protein insertase [Microgenomates group bacterium]